MTTLVTSSAAALARAAGPRPLPRPVGESLLAFSLFDVHGGTVTPPFSWVVYENLELSAPRPKAPPPAPPKARFVGCYKFEDSFGP